MNLSILNISSLFHKSGYIKGDENKARVEKSAKGMGSNRKNTNIYTDFTFSII